jgi:hypothetical protein
MDEKVIMLTTNEWRLVLHGLNKLRNSLIAEGRYTDFVDELIVKISKARSKKVRAA